MSKEAIPLKTYIFPPYQLLFGAGFFATYPTVLPYPAQDDVLSEHNLKSAGRFHRHCVRFLWRHKTLIDIKPRGYFNFLRLHPPGSPSHPFSCSPRLVLYDSPDMYTNPLCLSSPKILGYPLPLLISCTMHSPGFYTTDPHFFRFSPIHSPCWSSKIVSVVFYNVISSDAFWRSYQFDSDVCDVFSLI